MLDDCMCELTTFDINLPDHSLYLWVPQYHISIIGGWMNESPGPCRRLSGCAAVSAASVWLSQMWQHEYCSASKQLYCAFHNKINADWMWPHPLQFPPPVHLRSAPAAVQAQTGLRGGERSGRFGNRCEKFDVHAEVFHKKQKLLLVTVFKYTGEYCWREEDCKEHMQALLDMWQLDNWPRAQSLATLKATWTHRYRQLRHPNMYVVIQHPLNRNESTSRNTKQTGGLKNRRKNCHSRRNSAMTLLQRAVYLWAFLYVCGVLIWSLWWCFQTG